jgi:hypothetical protein
MEEIIEGNRKPWDLAKMNENLTVEELANRLLLFKNTRLDMCCMVSFLFLTGSRLREITRYKKEKNIKFMRELEEQPGIMFKDVVIKKFREGDTINEELCVTTRVLKTRIEKETKKTIHIPVTPNYYCWPFVCIVKEYMEEVGYFTDGNYYEDNTIIKNNSTKEFFKIGWNWSEAWMEKNLKINPHACRHLRWSALCSRDGLDAFEIMTAGQWQNFSMPFLYSKGSQTQIRKKSWDLVKKEEDK